MMARTPNDTGNEHQEDVAKNIDRDIARKLRSHREGRKGVWFGLGMFGLVGWSVAVPSLLGLGAGIFLDARFPGRVSWTVTCLVVGVVLGCLNAWYWVKQEGRF